MKQRKQGNQLFAVWGSLGAGKTVTAAKLAWQYAAWGKDVALVFCDVQSPTLSCLTGEDALSEQHSLGSIFAAKHIIPSLVEANQCQLKQVPKLHLYSFLKGEHQTDYPPVSRRQAEELLQALCLLYPIVILDCSSDLYGNLLTMTGLLTADEIVQLMSCELKSISYYASQMPYLEKQKEKNRRVYRVLSNVKDEALAGKLYRQTAFALPYTAELEKQVLVGDLFQDLKLKQSRAYVEELKQLAEELES